MVINPPENASLQCMAENKFAKIAFKLATKTLGF